MKDKMQDPYYEIVEDKVPNMNGSIEALEKLGIRMTSKIYIAGRISNYPEYKEHFQRAEEYLRKQNCIVLNPAMFPAGLTQEEYMRACIPMLQISDSIYMLEGWEQSVGATIEHDLALQAKKAILYETDHKRVSKEDPTIIRDELGNIVRSNHISKALICALENAK